MQCLEWIGWSQKYTVKWYDCFKVKKKKIYKGTLESGYRLILWFILTFLCPQYYANNVIQFSKVFFFLSVIIYYFVSFTFRSLWYSLVCCTSMMIISCLFTISTIFLHIFCLFLKKFWKYYISFPRHELLWTLWNMYCINDSWHSIINQKLNFCKNSGFCPHLLVFINWTSTFNQYSCHFVICSIVCYLLLSHFYFTIINPVQGGQKVEWQICHL